MGGRNQKLKLLYLAKIFYEKTDEHNHLTFAEIKDELEKYEVETERKTFYDDIRLLREFGMDIESERAKNFGYYLSSRDFELPELKILVDAVQSSKFISERKSSELISKLSSLTSEAQAKQLKRKLYISNSAKTDKNTYYNIDAIHTAIYENRQLSFRYYEWSQSSSHAMKSLRRNGENYVISPFALVWDNENYYVVAYYKTRENISHFRVDKMDNVVVTDECREGIELFKDFNLAEYTKKSFGMFSGEEIEVKLKFIKDNRLLGAVVDRFGSDIYISSPDSEHFAVTLKVTKSPVFWGWLFSFGSDVEIVSPKSLKQEYTARLIDIIEKNG
ncbi:MAG: helix-turn-helix transcriptional regulator [Oscillospiraceae bacterium]